MQQPVDFLASLPEPVPAEYLVHLRSRRNIDFGPVTGRSATLAYARQTAFGHADVRALHILDDRGEVVYSHTISANLYWQLCGVYGLAVFEDDGLPSWRTAPQPELLPGT